MTAVLPVSVAVIALLSFFLAPRANSEKGFFLGHSPSGEVPSLLTLVLSQVTTWVFARSLMSAAILGFDYGVWGTLAYAAYYLSFLTGAAIVNSIRFQHGFNSVQDFLRDRFGTAGTVCYNIVIGLRLISEVFANILVIGLLFGTAGSGSYALAVTLFALVTLAYSMFGGLHASLKTDVLQMVLFLITLVVLVVMALSSGYLNTDAIFFKPFVMDEPGPILLFVALLQVVSYPMHDPVMMDRGFIADKDTTRKSFIHAAWVSIICVMLFGLLGVMAGANVAEGESMVATLTRLLGENTMLVFNIALLISAMSTLDSTLSSSAKLVALDMRMVKPTIQNGRIAMAVFMLLGLGFVFVGNEDLFSAVAVSGTASMYLVPVIFISLWWGKQDVPTWSYIGAFVLAIAGAALYFTESSKHTAWMGDAHKYTKLLYISGTVFVGGLVLFMLGRWITPKTHSQGVHE